ncbi:hypothetical protein NUW54_g12522 [Trametes sanguinea]|uniref:Uncharacterized protein n=1 Tax=Trametes sanguinea TaxID=158606 RepID=A0ACC1MWH9_9APHY|nr:hypothetical protein NUW54_g12522 [Trametes sanguinea]
MLLDDDDWMDNAESESSNGTADEMEDDDDSGDEMEGHEQYSMNADDYEDDEWDVEGMIDDRISKNDGVDQSDDDHDLRGDGDDENRDGTIGSSGLETGSSPVHVGRFILPLNSHAPIHDL